MCPQEFEKQLGKRGKYGILVEFVEQEYYANTTRFSLLHDLDFIRGLLVFSHHTIVVGYNGDFPRFKENLKSLRKFCKQTQICLTIKLVLTPYVCIRKIVKYIDEMRDDF
jgi:hypothetical protein